MLKIITLKNGKQFRLNPSAYSIMVYKEITGRDMFNDLTNTYGKGEVDISVLLNILYSFCYSEAPIDYKEFFQELSVDVTMDTNLFKELSEIIKQEFKIDVVKPDNTPSE